MLVTLFCLCRPFRIFDKYLDSNPSRSKQTRYQLSHPSTQVIPVLDQTYIFATKPKMSLNNIKSDLTDYPCGGKWGSVKLEKVSEYLAEKLQSSSNILEKVTGEQYTHVRDKIEKINISFLILKG